MNITEHYSQVRRNFDRHASRYLHNPVSNWVGQSELAALKSMVPARRQGDSIHVLDFGCGTGRVTAMLLEMGYKVTGYDLSPAMLDQARITFGDNPKVIFTSDSQAIHTKWSLIVALGILDYYKDTAPLWNEWSQLIAPSGTLLVTAPNALSPLAWWYSFFSRFTCQAYTADAETVIQVAQSNGFSLIDLKTVFPKNQWGHTLVFGFRSGKK